MRVVMRVKARYFVFFIALTSLLSCSDRYQLDGESSLATIQFSVPLINIEKQILVVDAYNALDCEDNKKLTKADDSYSGVLLYHEGYEQKGILEKVKVSANQPIVLSISLSQVTADEKTEICYYQYFGFTPEENSLYEIQLNQYCEMAFHQLFKTTSNSVEGDDGKAAKKTISMQTCR